MLFEADMFAPRGHRASTKRARVLPVNHPLEHAAQQHRTWTHGFDFGRVRVHADANSADLADQLGARAFTAGEHVFFGRNEYAPHSKSGRDLIAHELAHVEQQRNLPPDAGLVIMRAPKPTVEKHHAGIAYEWFSIRGIQLLVGVPDADLKQVLSNLDAIARAINESNLLISDPKQKVLTCIIGQVAESQFVTYKGLPAVVLPLGDATSDTVRHEMTHAIFNFAMSPTASGSVADLPLQVSDIFALLAKTKPVSITTRKSDGTTEVKTLPVGLTVFDPSRWSKTKSTEHPWDTADELLASAREAVLVDRTGLLAAIDAGAKADPSMKKPALDLVDIIDALNASKPIRRSIQSAAGARKALADAKKVGTLALEDMLKQTRVTQGLAWLLDPSTIPADESPEPSTVITSPAVPKPQEHPNLVKQIIDAEKQRMIDRIIQSAENVD